MHRGPQERGSCRRWHVCSVCVDAQSYPLVRALCDGLVPPCAEWIRSQITESARCSQCSSSGTNSSSFFLLFLFSKLFHYNCLSSSFIFASNTYYYFLRYNNHNIYNLYPKKATIRGSNPRAARMVLPLLFKSMEAPDWREKQAACTLVGMMYDDD
jgi:hypothetical protein